MDPRLTSLEVIGMAIRSEEDAAKIYGHISTMIQNDLVREKYRQLAKEEGHHREMLVDLYKRISGITERPPRIPGTPVTAEGGALPPEIANSLEDLLRHAIEREQKAKDFYSEAADQATDLSGRKILLYLSGVEHGHALILKGELDAYLRDKDWYQGRDPEYLHLGP